MEIFDLMTKMIRTSKNSDFVMKNEIELNNCIDHIVNLLSDSFILLTNGSYGTSVFLSITALEEIGKTHFSIFMEKSEFKKKILKNHATKECLSISPVFKLGSRIVETIGNEKIDSITNLMGIKNSDSKLFSIRNDAIYWNYVSDKITFPKDHINESFAQELLLVAIESFDDSLVGYSEYSIEISKKTDGFFEKIKQNYDHKD